MTSTPDTRNDRTDEWNNLGPDDVVICVMGVTGAGKSTFIGQVTGEDVVVGYQLASETAAVSIFPYQKTPDSQRIYLVDTPGFDDTSRSDTETLKETAFFLSQIYRNNITLAGIIYLHRITDNRLGGTALLNLNMLKSLCGKHAWAHVNLMTSMWNLLNDESIGTKRENELLDVPEFWGSMHQQGSQVSRWLGEKESAMAIVDQVIDRLSGSDKPVLQIQKELINEGLSLDQTAAGKAVQREYVSLKAQLRDQIRDLRIDHEEMTLGIRNKRAEKELANRQHEAEERLQRTVQAEEALKMSFQKLLDEKEAEYMKLFSTMNEEQQTILAALRQKDEDLEHLRKERNYQNSTFEEARNEILAQLVETNEKVRAQERRHRRLLNRSLKAQEMRHRESEEAYYREIEQERQEALALREELERMHEKELQEKEQDESDLEKQREKHEKRKRFGKRALGLVGVLAGVGMTAGGIATVNPLLIAGGVMMVGPSVKVMAGGKWRDSFGGDDAGVD